MASAIPMAASPARETIIGAARAKNARALKLVGRDGIIETYALAFSKSSLSLAEVDEVADAAAFD